MKQSKRVFIWLISLPIVLLSAVGCNKRYDNKENITKYLTGNQMGECSIQNISNYSAIGVTNLSTIQTGKRNRFVDLSNEEEETYRSEDCTYSLVGLTTDNIVEELDLLTAGGESIKSSNLNITYYDECGDFVFFSVLPMSITDFASLVKTSYMKSRENNSYFLPESEEVVKWAVYNPISRLSYPLFYSLRYYDSKTKVYEYIDTSYLIHKPSGKIFPCSSHRQYIDASHINIDNWFRCSTDWIETEKESDYQPTLGDVFFSNDYRDYNTGPCGWFDRYDCYLASFLRKSAFNFPNGFCTGNCFDDFDSHFYRECFGIRLSNGLIVKFNDSTSSLEVTKFDGVSFAGSDKYGNLLAIKDGSRFIYKQSTGLFVPANDLKLEFFTKRFVDRRDNQIVFYDAELNEAITVVESGNELPVGSFLLYDTDRGLEYYDFDNKVCRYDRDIYKLIIDDADSNIQITVSAIKRLPEAVSTWMWSDNEHIIYNSSFSLVDGIVYRIDFNNNFELVTLDFNTQYTIKELFLDQSGQYLAFRGIENSTLADVEGYITEDGTVTFDVKEMHTTVSVFSPIN